MPHPPYRTDDEVIAWIKSYWQKTTQWPTQAEITEGLGYSSTSQLQHRLKKLVSKFLLYKGGHDKYRSLKLPDWQMHQCKCCHEIHWVIDQHLKASRAASLPEFENLNRLSLTRKLQVTHHRSVVKLCEEIKEVLIEHHSLEAVQNALAPERKL